MWSTRISVRASSFPHWTVILGPGSLETDWIDELDGGGGSIPLKRRRVLAWSRADRRARWRTAGMCFQTPTVWLSIVDIAWLCFVRVAEFSRWFNRASRFTLSSTNDWNPLSWTISNGCRFSDTQCTFSTLSSMSGPAQDTIECTIPCFSVGMLIVRVHDFSFTLSFEWRSDWSIS